MTDDDAIRVLQNRMAFSLDSYILAQDHVIARLLSLRTENVKLTAVAEAAEKYRALHIFVEKAVCLDAATLERVGTEAMQIEPALDAALKGWRA